MIFDRYIKNYMYEFDQLDRCFWNYEDGCVLIGAQAVSYTHLDVYKRQAVRMLS